MTSAELTRLGRTPFEFVLVDDRSPDDGATLETLTGLARDYPYVKVISLAKNSGQHNAVMAGLNYVEGDYIIAMDDDMQTHPSQLHFLLEEIDKGYDIVYGYYPKKKHSGFRNLGSYLNYLTVRILIGKPKDMRTSSYWVIRRFVRDYVIQYQSPYTHLQGLFLRTTRNISCIPIEHFEREVGESGYTFSKLVQLYSNIMGYSVVPLRLSTYCGYLFSAISILGALIALINLSKNKILNAIGMIYVNVLRGTPLLVQMYIAYFFIPIAIPALNSITKEGYFFLSSRPTSRSCSLQLMMIAFLTSSFSILPII